MVDTAEVYAVNQALFQLGQDPVTDLSQASLKGSVAATKLVRVMDQARDLALARHGWVNALEYPVLAPVTLPGFSDWRYPSVFKLPSDCLRVWEVEGVGMDGGSGAVDGYGAPIWATGCGAGPRWQVGSYEPEGGGAQTIIRAGWPGPSPGTVDSLNVCYVRRCGWGAMPPHLLEYAVTVLAWKGCYSVTGKQDRAAQLEKAAEEAALKAISVDGAQEGGQPPLAGSRMAAIRAMSR